MIYDVLNLASIFVLFALSLWCIFSSNYDDGLVGKVIFMFMAMSCFAVATDYPSGPADITKTTLLVTMASAAARHVFLFQIYYRLPFKRIKGFFND